MMASTWRQILVPAVLTLAAGLLIGFTWGQRNSAAPVFRLDADLQVYHHGLVHELRLSREQSESLLILLRKYQLDRERILREQRIAAEPRLILSDKQIENLFYKYVLDENQQQQWQSLLQITWPNAADEPLPAVSGRESAQSLFGGEGHR